MALQVSISSTFPLPRLRPNSRIRREKSGFRCRSSVDGKEEYYIDAEESIGDGFSFSGGKYSDGPSRSDEWLARGKMVKAHPVYSSKGKAKDPLFGLTMGAGSQSSADIFRWFCVEAGITSNPSVLLIHGFPSQGLHVAYFLLRTACTLTIRGEENYIGGHPHKLLKGRRNTDVAGQNNLEDKITVAHKQQRDQHDQVQAQEHRSNLELTTSKGFGPTELARHKSGPGGGRRVSVQHQTR